MLTQTQAYHMPGPQANLGGLNYMKHTPSADTLCSLNMPFSWQIAHREKALEEGGTGQEQKGPATKRCVKPIDTRHMAMGVVEGIFWTVGKKRTTKRASAATTQACTER